jgi:hypothetical protein
MSTPTASYPFDARPLVEPVDAATARAYAQELRRAGRAPAGATTAVIVIFAVVAVFLLVIFSVVGAITSSIASAVSGGAMLGTLLPLGFLVFVAIAVSLIVLATRRSSRERWYRLDRFARANGMTWYPEATSPPLPGMVFTRGHSRKATDIIRGERPRFVEFGNYRYTTGSGKNQTTHHWGYVAVKLSSPLPHIVLDATSNNGLFGSNLPASFDRDQRLSLEGDFDDHFSLYCPEGYGADALYLFTPDIMARFIDNAAALDVEIIDDWMFLYSRRQFATLDPATWAWLFSVVGALLDKFAQWERWRDDRLLGATAPSGPTANVPGAAGSPRATDAAPFAAPGQALRPPPGVAPQGRRLHRAVPWAGIAIVAGMLLLSFLSQAGAFGALFGGIVGR